MNAVFSVFFSSNWAPKPNSAKLFNQRIARLQLTQPWELHFFSDSEHDQTACRCRFSFQTKSKVRFFVLIKILRFFRSLKSQVEPKNYLIKIETSRKEFQACTRYSNEMRRFFNCSIVCGEGEERRELKEMTNVRTWHYGWWRFGGVERRGFDISLN